MYGGVGPRRRWRGVLGAVLAAALLVVGAYALGAATVEREPSDVPAAGPEPAPPQTERPELAQLPAAEPSDDPIASAVAWLVSYRSVRYDDAAPTAWIDRVSPIVTDGLGREYERYREGSAGAEWEEFVRQRCTATVEDADGVIPAEAPRSRSSLSVQVAGSLQTTCPSDGGESRPAEELAATVQLLKGGDGLWRVNRRLY